MKNFIRKKLEICWTSDIKTVYDLHIDFGRQCMSAILDSLFSHRQNDLILQLYIDLTGSGTHDLQFNGVSQLATMYTIFDIILETIPANFAID